MPDFVQHEELYRGQDIVANRSNKHIVVFGVGALGSWIIDLLVRQGYNNLTVVDFDRVEQSNCGTQNYGLRDVGRKKSTITATNVYLKFGVKIEAIDKKITHDNVNSIVKNANLLIDVFDNPESRQVIKNVATKFKIPCLHAGMSANGFAQIEWNETYQIYYSALTNENQPCEYPLAANLVHITSSIVAEIINKFVDHGIKKSVHFTLNDLKVDIL